MIRLAEKTYPLRMSKEYHEKLKKAAHKENTSIQDFVFKAIDEKIKKHK